jgi:hypothetical protein
MRKHIRLLLPAALLLAAPMLRAEMVEGILMDKMCSGMVAEKGFGAAKMHTKECALMPNCAASGYGVVTEDGEFLKFDASGDKKASEALKATGKKDNITVSVDGKVSGDTITVQSLKIT